MSNVFRGYFAIDRGSEVYFVPHSLNSARFAVGNMGSIGGNNAFVRAQQCRNY